MRRLNFVLTAILSGWVMMSCSTVKNATEQNELSKALQGEWMIDHEICCGRNSSVSYGGNSSIKFNTKKSTYTIFNGNHAIQKGSYSLSKGEIGTMIKMDESFPAIIRIEEGMLYIDRSYMDLERKVYSK